MLSLGTKKAKQPPMPNRSRRRCLPSSKHIGNAPLLHAVPLGEPTGDLESKFTVYECPAQLLGADSIDSPAARSALAKI